MSCLLDVSGAAAQEVLAGVYQYALEQKGRWLLHVEPHPWTAIESLARGNAHGALVCSSNPDLLAALAALRLPAIGIRYGMDYDRAFTNCPLCYFDFDDRAIGRLAAEHLLSLGVGHLAYVGLASEQGDCSSARREAAFCQRAADAAVACSLRRVAPITSENWSQVQHELSPWLQSLPQLTGLLAYNDHYARSVLDICRGAEIRVPLEIALLGVNNDAVLCELSPTPLSSIQGPGRTLSYEAAKKLNGLMLAGSVAKPAAQLLVPAGVVVRQSTDCRKVSDGDVAIALEYIAKHAHEHLQVQDVVEAAGVSRATLKRKFDALLGHSISQEIRRRQMEMAQRLLRTSELSVRQIAKRSGFSSAEYLTAVFKTTLGTTPKAYRDRSKAQAATQREG